MARGRAPREPRDRALADVAAVLDALGRPAAIIGGLAVIAWGFARFTGDIDCAIAASTEELKRILERFQRAGFEPRNRDTLAFAEQNLVLLLRHRATSIEVDVSLAQIDFEARALEGAVRRRVGGVEIPVPTVSDLFIYKLVAARPKDLEDVKELMALGHDYDAERIEETLAAFDELLDTDRLGDWHRLKARA